MKEIDIDIDSINSSSYYIYEQCFGFCSYHIRLGLDRIIFKHFFLIGTLWLNDNNVHTINAVKDVFNYLHLIFIVFSAFF